MIFNGMEDSRCPFEYISVGLKNSIQYSLVKVVMETIVSFEIVDSSL